MEHWVAVLRIEDGARRGRVMKKLLVFGEKIRPAVVELTLEDEQLGALRERLADDMDPAEDHLRLYPICGSCVKKTLDLGKKRPQAFETPSVIVF